MMVWKYTIQSDAGVIVTRNSDYAEKRSKLGNRDLSLRIPGCFFTLFKGSKQGKNRT